METWSKTVGWKPLGETIGTVLPVVPSATVALYVTLVRRSPTQWREIISLIQIEVTLFLSTIAALIFRALPPNRPLLGFRRLELSFERVTYQARSEKGFRMLLSKCRGTLKSSPVRWLLAPPHRLLIKGRSVLPSPALLPVSPDRMWSLEVVLGAGAVVILLVLSSYWTGRQYPRPPGPRPIPILGNIFDMPRSQYALAWARLGQKYGPLTWLAIPGQNFLILNSMEAARELLDKRGFIYADRPRWVMAGELMGLDSLTPLSRSNPAWRKHRSLLKHSLSPQVVKRDYSIQLTKKAHQYLHCLLTRPEDFLVDLGRIVAENVVELTYGNRTDDKGRDLVELNYHIMHIILPGMQGYIVDMLPVLRHLPSWLPGMNFKRDAAKWKAEIDEAKQTIFGFAKRSLATANPSSDSSFMTNNLRELYRKHEDSIDVGQIEEDELAISNSGFSFFLAGVETTQYSLHSFLLAMVLFPSVQEKAHAEIDAVVGSQRLPTFDDQQNMPYLHAVLLETLRWNPVVPMGLPHTLLKDDIYGEYPIPKGTVVIGNSWGISRNTQYYEDPSTFDPERYLKPNPDLDPRQFVFGFGRRICPGSELAFRAIWITAASILWAFKLKRTEGDTAALDQDLERFSFGSVSVPATFKCQFVPKHSGLKDALGSS